MDFPIQSPEQAFATSWLYKSRIVAWSGSRLLTFSLSFLAALMLSFSSGAWLGQRLNNSFNKGYNTAFAPVEHERGYPGNEQEVAQAPEESRIEPAYTAIKVSYTIEKHDNLFDVLHSFGVKPDTIRQWTKICSPHYDIGRVHPGQSFDLALDDENEPLLFVFHVSSSSYLVVEASEDGYSARVENNMPEFPDELPKPKMVAVPFRYVGGQIQFQDPATGEWSFASKAKIKTISAASHGRSYFEGRVKDSFYKAAETAGMAPSQIMELIDVFACEIDFRKDIRKGDAFKVLLDRPGKNPKASDKQIVLAAMIETGKKQHWAFYHQEGNKSGHYDEKGQSLKGFNLIVPVKYTRISSGYTSRRYHPIHKIYRPHYAVDYAAPYGTPVRAAASGTITYCGWKGGYGRYIQIQHNSKYATSYGHLSRYARGMRKGVRVRQGQIIGYVGTTGLATGSHLDYQVFKYGKRINPLKFHGEKGSRVANINSFQVTKSRLMRELESSSSAKSQGILTSSAAGS